MTTPLTHGTNDNPSESGTTHAELRGLAEATLPMEATATGGNLDFATWARFQQAAGPATVLGLLDTIDRLTAELAEARDNAEAAEELACEADAERKAALTTPEAYVGAVSEAVADELERVRAELAALRVEHDTILRSVGHPMWLPSVADALDMGEPFQATASDALEVVRAVVAERDGVIRGLRREVERFAGELAAYRGAPLLAAEINALPIRVRVYIRDIETRCDPTGDIQTIASLTEQRDGLVLRLREMEDMLVAAGIYHPDPTINAEVKAEAAENAAFDLAAGVVPGWHRFVDCDAEHPCPRCGYTGVPGTTHSTECLYLRAT